MKILLTGATGFIGLHTSKFLKKEGNYIINFTGDVTKVKDWEVGLSKRPEAIVHVAGIRTESEEDIRVNTGGIQTLLRALKIDYTRLKILVYISTQAVYAGQTTPFKDNVRLNPKSSYAKSKFNAERIALKIGKKYGIRVIILRLSTTLGSGVRENNKMSGPLAIWTKNALKGGKIEVFQDGLQSRDYVHVKDVAKAIALSIKSLKMEGTYNVGGGKSMTLLSLAKLIKAGTKSSSEIVILGGKSTINDPRNMLSDISKIKKIGWRPTKSVKTAVSEFVASSGKH